MSLPRRPRREVLVEVRAFSLNRGELRRQLFVPDDQLPIADDHARLVMDDTIDFGAGIEGLLSGSSGDATQQYWK